MIILLCLLLSSCSLSDTMSENIMGVYITYDSIAGLTNVVNTLSNIYDKDIKAGTNARYYAYTNAVNSYMYYLSNICITVCSGDKDSYLSGSTIIMYSDNVEDTEVIKRLSEYLYDLFKSTGDKKYIIYKDILIYTGGNNDKEKRFD